ncbi:paraspeckle component 1-like isoform X2 [Asterias rubens]|uniref:paraspeckle component 1-like isoform X2 n=1 Tax=Asterias rubens TaxID=7604 RepID=UPI0014557B2B|nr:paraspeckle component 1-like isoform X2 [Asterias rubens]
MNRGRNDRPYRGGHRSNYDNRKNQPQRPAIKKEVQSPSPNVAAANNPRTPAVTTPNAKPNNKDEAKVTKTSHQDTKQELNKSMERGSSSISSSGDRDNRRHHQRDHDRRDGGMSGGHMSGNHGGHGGPGGNHDQMMVESATRKTEKKFTQRCRLFVGNLTPDTTEDEFKGLFEKYGEISEVFLNKSKGFGFIRLDTRYNAEAAKAELDGTMRKNRMLRVRFATHGAALKVKSIPPCVSNELLEQAFSQFGVVERAVVIVDDRGRPTSEGIVEFARKPGAQNALTRIKEGVFLITSSPNPISVEPLEQRDEEDGLPEKNLPKNQAYHHERENPPRFASPGSFEFQWGNRWKALEDSERQQRETLERKLQDNRDKMEGEMDMIKHEHQAVMMRQELVRRQEELNRLEEAQREMQLKRQEQMHQREEQRRREEVLMKQQQEEMLRRQQQGGGGGGGVSMHQEMRRRQADEMGMRGNGPQGQINPASGMGGPGNSQGLLSSQGLQALQSIQGQSGGNGNGGRMGPGQGQSRQSRFEQAPPAMGGRGQGGPGGMGGPQQSGGSYGGASAGGPRPLDEIRTRPPPRDMDRRERRDDYMPKRARHY